MSTDSYFVCIVRDEALTKKIIIVEPDTEIRQFYSMVADGLAIPLGTFEIYFKEALLPVDMQSGTEIMAHIGMDSDPDSRNNFIVLNCEKKKKKSRVCDEAETDSRPTPVSIYTAAADGPVCIGIRNQGSTCYLNCILQVLFWSPEIRNAVLRWQLGPEVEGTLSSLAELQKLFVRLWLSSLKSQNTDHLTKSLGIRSVHVQEDVYEKFNWLLCHLETKLNSLEIKDTISPLFLGEQESFLKCQECGVKTSKVEAFNGLMLPIRDPISRDNFESLQQALDAYCTTETLTNDDKCHCATCGDLRVMEKQLLFKKMPDVLNIVLLRFQSMSGVNTKLHHRVQYPKEIQMSEYVTAEEQVWYDLHSAIIHSGSADAGHYLCIVKDTTGKFVRINDQKVEWLSDEDFNSTFGGHDGNRVLTKSAYILTYRRRESLNLSNAPLQMSDVDNGLKEKFQNYLGGEIAISIGHRRGAKGVSYRTLHTNKLVTIAQLLAIAQDAFAVIEDKRPTMRLVCVDPKDNSQREIDSDAADLGELIKRTPPFTTISFMLVQKGDSLRANEIRQEEVLKKNIVVDQPLVLNHQTLATKSPHLQFMGETYYGGESVLKNQLYVTVHLLNNENNNVMKSTCAFPRAELERIKSVFLETPVAIKTANTLSEKISEINRVLLCNQFRALKMMEVMHLNSEEIQHSNTGQLDVYGRLEDRLPHLVWWIVHKEQNC